ncbi:MAG TPA: hypothetical protein VFV84_03395 [Burkholderiales bacterium]|nr:hypothetical protein [Burkholderiales bacterium]
MSALAAAIQESRWLGPTAFAMHLAGVALLLGTISVVDLRLLGLWRRMPVRRLTARLLPWTAASFLLIVPAGLLMFLAHADVLIDSGVFALKMGLILAAGVNAAVFHTGAYRGAAAWDVDRMPPPVARLAGGLSLALWLSVVACALSLPHG